MTELEAMIQPLWQRLGQIGQFSFAARNGAGSATDWNGSAQGVVQVQEQANGWLFNEQGYYLTPHGKRIAMSNRFYWQCNAQGILLSHLRYQQPVELFELQPVDSQHWQSVAPHICRADRYQAELVWQANGFSLTWQIIGPHKNEQIVYHYQLA